MSDLYWRAMERLRPHFPKITVGPVLMTSRLLHAV